MRQDARLGAFRLRAYAFARSGAFSHCEATVRGEVAAALTFRTRDRREIGVLVTAPSLTPSVLVGGERTSLAFGVDGAPAMLLAAGHRAGIDTFAAALPQPAFHYALQRARALSISVGRATFRFPADGAADAMTWLARCPQQTMAAVDRAPSAPPAHEANGAAPFAGPPAGPHSRPVPEDPAFADVPGVAGIPGVPELAPAPDPSVGPGQSGAPEARPVPDIGAETGRGGPDDIASAGVDDRVADQSGRAQATPPVIGRAAVSDVFARLGADAIVSEDDSGAVRFTAGNLVGVVRTLDARNAGGLRDAALSLAARLCGGAFEPRIRGSLPAAPREPAVAIRIDGVCRDATDARTIRAALIVGEGVSTFAALDFARAAGAAPSESGEEDALASRFFGALVTDLRRQTARGSGR